MAAAEEEEEEQLEAEAEVEAAQSPFIRHEARRSAASSALSPSAVPFSSWSKSPLRSSLGNIPYGIRDSNSSSNRVRLSFLVSFVVVT